MNTLPVVKTYITGPIYNIDGDNRNAFHRAEKQIGEQGYKIITPFTAIRNTPSWSEWKDIMKERIKNLMDCERLYVLKGWQRSVSAVIEIVLASVFGIRVVFKW